MNLVLFPSEAVMVFGDNFAGGQTGHEGISFAARLQRSLKRGRPGLQVYCLDILGEMTNAMPTRFCSEAPRRYHEKNVLVFWGGFKDTGVSESGRLPVTSGSVFQANMRTLLQKIPERITVFVLGFYSIDGNKTNPWPITGMRYDAGRVLDFNGILRAVTEGRTNSFFVPTAHLIKLQDLVADGVHLTPRGYGKVVRMLAPRIREQLDAQT